MKGDLKHTRKVRKWQEHEGPSQIPVQIEKENATDKLILMQNKNKCAYEFK
jgi:hypothetical protein